jgi:hypothetical protein
MIILDVKSNLVKKYLDQVFDSKEAIRMGTSYTSPMSTNRIKKAQQMYEKIITKPSFSIKQFSRDVISPLRRIKSPDKQVGFLYK